MLEHDNVNLVIAGDGPLGLIGLCLISNQYPLTIATLVDIALHTPEAHLEKACVGMLSSQDGYY